MARPKADKPPPTQQALTPEEEADVEARFREALKVALNTPARIAAFSCSDRLKQRLRAEGGGLSPASSICISAMEATVESWPRASPFSGPIGIATECAARAHFKRL